MSRMDKELVSLFGSSIYKQAKYGDINKLDFDCDLVAEGAGQLMAHISNPKKQRQVVQCMDEETATALCMWIMNANMMSKALPEGLHYA